jgi:hypothetical protein
MDQFRGSFFVVLVRRRRRNQRDADAPIGKRAHEIVDRPLEAAEAVEGEDRARHDRDVHAPVSSR